MPSRAGAQVLQQVPSDALLVVKFKQLKPTSDKIAGFAKKVGLTQFAPQLADPLTTLQRQMNAQQGIDPNGEAAFYIPNAPFNDKNQPMVLLLPVSDFNAFLGNFPNGKTDAGVTTVRLGRNPMDSYIV